ncbi:FecR domain-containing protein [Aquimarina sp. 2-A2]|uniref:FecR domain-containing protein n=1 Tax=Aquimarina sp. 2-A2 TaxID=3382644 RepID=UPI00387EFB76
MPKKICVILFLWNVLVFSQEETNIDTFKDTYLIEALPQIEQYYSITFSYLDQILADKTISIRLAPELKLTDVLTQIEQQALLKIENIGTTIYSLRPYQSQDLITLCATLLDEQQIAIPNAQITTLPENSVVVTDDRGYFIIEEIPYGSILEIDLPGYAKKQVLASEIFNSTCTYLEVFSSALSLDQVLIKDFIAKGISLNRKTIQIKIKDLQALPGLTEPDILYSIQLIPGVNSPYETASGLYVRGSTPHQNLVLWNGIKTYHHAHLYGMLSAFNPYAVDEVLFYKSGTPEHYGDRLASIIDIRTSSEISDTFKGSFGINMINADAIVDIPIIKDQMSIKLSGRRSYTDQLETFTYKKLADRAYQNTKLRDTQQSELGDNTFYFLDYNASINYKITKNDTLQLNTLYSKNTLRFDQNTDQKFFTDNLFTENEGYNVKWNHTYGSNLKQEISLYYTKYALNYAFKTDSITRTVEVRAKENSIRDLGGAVSLNYAFDKKNTISTGYQYSKKRFKHGFATSTPEYFLMLDQDDRKLETHAGHFGYQYDDAKNWFFSTGVRLSHYAGLQKTFIEPRIVIQKHLTPNFEINATAEFRSQSDSNIRESVLSDLALENEIWKLADTINYPIATSSQYSMGASFKKRGWNFDADFYHKHIKGITTLTAGFINPIDNQYHEGKSEIYGMDVFVKKKIKRFNSWLSYSYINTQNFFSGVNDNKYFPGNWNIRHSVRWTSFYDLDNFRFSLGWFWHSGKAYTQVKEVEDENGMVTLQYGTINSTSLPTYHRMDFSVIYNFQLKQQSKLKYRLGLSILNIYDNKTLINKEVRSTNTLENEYIFSDKYGIRFTPNVSLRVLW